MIIEQAATAAGFELIDNAPPVKQRGAMYWRKFISALYPQIQQLQSELLDAHIAAARARTQAAELRQQLAEQQTSPLEMLLCRARQGREQLEQTYKQLALRLHPDHGGSTAGFQQLRADYEQVQQLFRSLEVDHATHTEA